MIAFATMLLFAFAFVLALAVIVATVQPELDRIVRLLRHGPMDRGVEMAAVHAMRARRVTPRRAAVARPAWREAA